MGLEPIGTGLRYEMKDEFHSLRAQATIEESNESTSPSMEIR